MIWEDSMLFHPLRNQDGIAMIIALMIMLMLTIIGLGIVKSANDEVSIAGNELNEARAFYTAEAGLEKASSVIQAHFDATHVPPSSFPSGTLLFNGIGCGYSIVAESSATRTITKTSLAGLKALIRPYHIESTACDSGHSTAVTLEQHFEVDFVPIFQFSVFYENDLEIAPGPSMLLLGRVHSNGDLYLQSNISLQINSYLTAYGDIYHGRKPGSGQPTGTGDVQIMGTDGLYHSMKDGSDWLDASDAHWFDSGSARWGGRVQDEAFGQERLNIPLQNSTDSAHKLIERASAGGGNADSYENKSTFKVIDGVAYSLTGTVWTNVTAALTASGAIVQTTFHDKREGVDVTVSDIDMTKFNASGYAPSNGIVYISDQRSGLRGARIYNAASIGRPLTIASENPVYTKGNVNTTTKQPMAIIADALTILSGSWDDAAAKAASNDKTVRVAASTTANFCFISGNTETGAGGAGYNGGLENLPRFLEDWTGKTFTYRGSMVNLWYSQEATGIWSGSYYTPPTRDWAYDIALDDIANMPPGTPMVRAFIRFAWKQKDVGFKPSEFGAAP